MHARTSYTDRVVTRYAARDADDAPVHDASLALTGLGGSLFTRLILPCRPLEIVPRIARSPSACASSISRAIGTLQLHSCQTVAGALSIHRQPKLAAPRATGVVALDVGGLWGSYLGALEQAPLVTKAITAGVIIGAGDSTAQLIETDEDADFDFARSLRWAVFGLVLQGPWNHFFYQLLDGALPPTPDPFTLRTLESERLHVPQAWHMPAKWRSSLGTCLQSGAQA